jgi:hypothetical protein
MFWTNFSFQIKIFTSVFFHISSFYFSIGIKVPLPTFSRRFLIIRSCMHQVGHVFQIQQCLPIDLSYNMGEYSALSYSPAGARVAAIALVTLQTCLASTCCHYSCSPYNRMLYLHHPHFVTDDC